MPATTPSSSPTSSRSSTDRPTTRSSTARARTTPSELIKAVVFDLDGVLLQSEEVWGGKPAPDVYLEAGRRLGVAPQQCAAVEDSHAGIRSAKATGMRVVAIPNASYPPDDEALGIADAVVRSLDELTVDVLRG